MPYRLAMPQLFTSRIISHLFRFVNRFLKLFCHSKLLFSLTPFLPHAIMITYLCRCSVCGDEQNQSIKELGHQIERVDEIEDTVLNVSHDDFHVERCTREDCDYEIEVKHSGRTYSYGATCEYPAYKEGTCSACRVKYRIYDETAPATDHNWSEEGVVEGDETVYECLNDKCDAVKREPLDLPPSNEE